MSKIPIKSGKEVVKAFEKAGFEIDRIKGSHYILKKENLEHALSVPVHSGKTLGRGLLSNLIKNAGLTVKEFIEYL